MAESIPNKGRCVSCGFLAKFDVHQSGPPPHFYEFPSRDRESGDFTAVRLDSGRQISLFPSCYLGEADLWTEIDQRVRGGADRPLAMLEVFRADRQCQKWYLYRPGFSPMQHHEAVVLTELEQKRQQFEQQMATDQKAVMVALDKSNKSFQFKITVVLAVIAVIEIIVGLLQVLYPMGWPIGQRFFGITPPQLPPAPPMPGV